MRPLPERHFRPYVPVAASVVLLSLLTVFVSVASGRWTEEFDVSGFVRTGKWLTPSPTFGSIDTALDADQTALGFFENGKFGVSGAIRVENGGLHATRGLQITSTIRTGTGKGQYIDYLQTTVDVSAMPVLAAGRKYLYAYKVFFDPVPGAQYLHNIRVTITNYTGWTPGDRNCLGHTPCPFGPERETVFVLPTPSSLPTRTSTARPVPTVNSVAPAPSGSTFTPVPPPSPSSTVVASTTPDPTVTIPVVPTPTASATSTSTPQVTPSPTLTNTPVNTPTPTASLTATVSPTLPAPPSVTGTPHITNPQGTPVLTPTETSTATPSLQATVPTATTPISLRATPTSSTASTTPTK